MGSVYGKDILYCVLLLGSLVVFSVPSLLLVVYMLTRVRFFLVLLSGMQAARGGPLAIAKALKGLKLKDLIPEAPAIANYTTGEHFSRSLLSLGVIRVFICSLNLYVYIIQCLIR